MEATMAQVPTPPESPPAGKLRKASPEDNTPPEALDALLERYLHLLDRHQKLQEELGKQLASGFFSLTQANYSCPPGRRYGEDYYDERMKATRTISIANSLPPPPAAAPTPSSSSEDQDQDQDQDIDIDLSTLLSLQLQTLSLSEPLAKLNPSNPAPKQEEEEQNTNTNTNTNTPKSKSPSAETEDAEDSQDSNPPSEEEEEEEASKPKPPRNPITWYGILVPPSLRSAQSSFTSAVDGPIPALAAIVVEMQDVERKVEAARRREEAGVNE